MLYSKRLNVFENVDLKKLCTIKIGGVARHVFIPTSVDELTYVYLRGLDEGKPVIPLGLGSNVIFKDGILEHYFISLRKLKKPISIEEHDEDVFLRVYAGTSFKEVITIVKKLNLEGFENLAGIPATVGGAIAMNAGAFGSEISDIIHKVFWLNKNGEIVESSREELDFSYRYSQFQKEGIIVSAILKLKKSKKPIPSIIKNTIISRNKKQPVDVPTSGSTYKNTDRYAAGYLLEHSGMKGYRIGDIGFSPKHANFLVNYGNATYTDLIKLLELAETKVNINFNIKLTREVKIIA